MQFNLVQRDGMSNITVVVDGDLYVADEQHPLFAEIVKGALADDESVVDLFDASKRVAKVFADLTGRVRVANSRVYFDGEELDDVFADQIVNFVDAGVEDWKPLVKFLVKVYGETEGHTRENLTRWLKSVGSFTINEDGDIVGYKGVTSALGSIHHGPAVVNGKAVNGSVPNQPGSVVEMQRAKVEANPAVACSVGLHVGTWEYASGFGETVLQVTVHPRDVVSVPTDCNGQKMRVARYKVDKVINGKHNVPVIPVEDYATKEEAYAEGFEDGYEEGYEDGTNHYC